MFLFDQKCMHHIHLTRVDCWCKRKKTSPPLWYWYMAQKSQTTTWDGDKTLWNAGISYQPQLVIAGFLFPSTGSVYGMEKTRDPYAVLFSKKKWFILLNSFHLEILRDGSGKFLRTDICQRCRESPPTNHHQIRQMHPKRLPIFWSFNWRPCCCLFHLEITHFEQVKRLPPLPTFPKWLDQWSKIHSPCHPRCRAILRCINSTKPPQPTVVLEEETDSPMEKKWSKKTKRLSQVID